MCTPMCWSEYRRELCEENRNNGNRNRNTEYYTYVICIIYYCYLWTGGGGNDIIIFTRSPFRVMLCDSLTTITINKPYSSVDNNDDNYIIRTILNYVTSSGTSNFVLPSYRAIRQSKNVVNVCYLLLYCQLMFRRCIPPQRSRQ